MAYLSLKGVGKIYVSDGNVAVGIRGVNLSFERGEFVAVTGESGSGKSTLLNIISGMDTYEEGELFIEGEPTSHFLQSDWEEYRERYISFIFQDYNIIDSFTVLENVELALMHIKSRHERRRRAIELLRRVGLGEHLHHRGSKLSGGQKQRTVIARALAKDSPIILADEPTGNLDSQSSAEIIALLREVAEDKLVIIVTHSFDQLAEVATRHIRVYDGTVESDRILRQAEPVSAPAQKVPTPNEAPVLSPLRRRFRSVCSTLSNGLILGFVRFRSMPRLSAFLSVLMIFTALTMTLLTSLSGSMLGLFDKNTVFTHIDGRTVIARRDGATISEEELARLVTQTGARSSLHYDFLLDREIAAQMKNLEIFFFRSSKGYSGVPDVGRAPAQDSEILLRLPISLRPLYGGKNGFQPFLLSMPFASVDYTVTGIDYYYNNNKLPVICFTESGYRTASALAIFDMNWSNLSASFAFTANGEERTEVIMGINIGVSFEIGQNTAYLLTDALNNAGATDITGTLSAVIRSSNEGDINTGSPTATEASAGMDCLITPPANRDIEDEMRFSNQSLLLSPDVLLTFIEEQYFPVAYPQASLMYRNDRQAEAAAKELNLLGYIAIPSSTTTEGGLDVLFNTVLLLLTAFVWFIGILFIALLLSLCSSRAILATKGDTATLRSMGIPTPVIRISIYIQTLLALIPAYLITALTATLIFTTPATNAIFPFVYGWEYLILALALLAINLLLSRRNIHRMFDRSVKKTLKGGAED